MKKRIISLVLVIAIILNFNITALAAGGATLTSTLPSDGNLKAGDTFTVTLTVPPVSGFASLHLGMHFEKSVLEVTSLSLPDTVGGYAAVITDVNEANVAGAFAVSFAQAQNISTTDTMVLSVDFKVRDGAMPNSYPKLVEVEDDDYDFTDEDDVPLTSVPALNTKTIFATILKSPISDVSKITAKVDAPQKGVTLDTSVDVDGATAYTGTVEWYKGNTAAGTAVTGPAAANQVYTAKITLTAKTADGESFDASLNGKDTAEGYKIKFVDASKLELTKTFDATADKDLTGLTVTTQPSKTTYVHGDGFDPAGMVVKAEYDDGTSNNDFKGYAVEYATVGKGYLCKGDTKVTLKKDGKSVDVTGLTVNAKALTVTGLTAVDREYEAGYTLVDLNGGTLTGVVSGETVSLLSTPTTGRISNAGVGNNKDVSIDPLSLTGTDAGNYTLTQPTGIKVNITRKDIDGANITLGTQATYNGTEQSVQIASVKDGTASLIAGDHDYSIVSGGKATNVGNNTLVIEGKGNYKGTASATWSLVARDVTITPTSGLSKTYGAADPELTYSTDLTAGSALETAFNTAKSGALSYTGTDVGAYPITLGSLAAGNNFNLKLAAATVNFTINKATPSITATSPRQLVKNNVEVDITKWASFDNTDSGAKLTYALDGAPAGIMLTTDNKLKAADDASTVSTFNIKVTATATTNFTAPTEKIIVVKVVTKSDAGVSITTPPASKTYGDANFSLAATKTAPNGGTWSWNSSNPAILEIVSGADTATPTIKVKKADTAGATLTVTYTSDTHYGSASATITVARKEVTISGITAANKEYDGSTTATPTGTAVINGKVGSDDVTVTAGTATFADKNVGTGKIVTFTGYSLSGADAGNYNLKAQPASVTANITAKVVKLTGGINATDRSYVKDNKTVGLTKGTLTFDGLVSGETLDVNIPATGTISDAKVGAYNVTYSGVTLKDGTTGKASNYKLVSPLPTVTVNITKASAAPALSNIPVSQKYNVTTGEKVIGSVMPADAGTLTYTKGTESKTGSVTVTSWAVDATGKVTYTLSGGKVNDTVTLSVVIKSTNYADATVNVVITIIKATPTGEPAYTKITTSGKTLNDAALTTTGSTLNPNVGTLEWVDDAENVLPGDTEVKANTNYKWRFTPADANYESISGTIKLWSKSSGGSGSYYPAGITFTTDLPADSINRVTVNGKKLDSKNYVVNGSDVTLLQSYLDTLKAGKYTVKIENKTHVSTGTFTIKADGTLSSPRTADAGVCLYAAMALMSGTGAAYVTLRRKKEN